MSKEPKFKSGDIVQLKSGGPSMTVDCIISNDSSWAELAGKPIPKGNDQFQYHCKWFYRDKMNTETFSESSLETAKENK